MQLENLLAATKRAVKEAQKFVLLVTFLAFQKKDAR
jgi:hypothetical protein